MVAVDTKPPPAESTPPPINEEFVRVAPKSLTPTKDNKRQFRPDQRFAELVESIRVDDIIEPLIARRTGTEGKFELRAGERRWHAANKLGLKTVPVIIRDYDDATALRITAKENLDRLDLRPLERAETIQEFYTRGLKTADIAAALGRSPAWVAGTAQLLALTVEWKKAIENDDHWANRWPVTSLQLIAALSSENQLWAFKQLGGDSGHGSHPARDLQDGRLTNVARWIANEITQELKNARWDLEDGALVPKAGSCAGCSKRTGVSPLLFEGLFDNDEVKKGDRCLDGKCWKMKVKAHATADLKAHMNKLENHEKLSVVRIYGADRSAVAAARALKLPIIDDYNVVDCAASAKDAIPVVTISANGLAKKQKFVKPISTPANQQVLTKPVAKKPATVAELRTDLEARRQLFAIDEWMAHILAEVNKLGQVVADKVDDFGLVAGLLMFEAYDVPENHLHHNGRLDRLHKEKVKKEFRYNAARNVLHGILDTISGETLEERLKLIAAIETHYLPDKLLDAEQVIAGRLATAEKEMPEPEAWKDREKAEKAAAAKKTVKKPTTKKKSAQKAKPKAEKKVAKRK